jgi:hypothetical protein
MSQYQALVLGASGAIGSAFVSHFQNDADLLAGCWFVASKRIAF